MNEKLLLKADLSKREGSDIDLAAIKKNNLKQLEGLFKTHGLITTANKEETMGNI